MWISQNGDSNLGITSRTADTNFIQGLGIVIKNSAINDLLRTIV